MCVLIRVSYNRLHWSPTVNEDLWIPDSLPLDSTASLHTSLESPEVPQSPFRGDPRYLPTHLEECSTLQPHKREPARGHTAPHLASTAESRAHAESCVCFHIKLVVPPVYIQHDKQRPCRCLLFKRRESYVATNCETEIQVAIQQKGIFGHAMVKCCVPSSFLVPGSFSPLKRSDRVHTPTNGRGLVYG